MTEQNKNCDKKNQTCTIMKLLIPGCGMKEVEMCLSITVPYAIPCFPGQGEIKDADGRIIGCECPPGEIFKDGKCNPPLGMIRDKNTNQLACKVDKRMAGDGKFTEVATEPVYFKDKNGNNTNVIAGCCAKVTGGRIRKEFFHEDDGTLLGCCAHGANGTCDIDRDKDNNGTTTTR